MEKKAKNNRASFQYLSTCCIIAAAYDQPTCRAVRFMPAKNLDAFASGNFSFRVEGFKYSFLVTECIHLL